jgi:hypothetical protein
LTVGTHALRASYSGNAIGAASNSASVAEIISADTTSTALTLAQASVIAASTATANVSVSSAYTVPTGTITLRSGATVLAYGPLANGSTGVAYATLSFNAATLGLGSFPLLASYSGDSGDQASTSSAATETVIPISTALALNISASSIAAQGSVTLTATVTATSTPTGSVTFLSNGSAIATVALTAGSAPATFTPASVGTYLLTATYAPGGLFGAAPASPAQTLTVVPPVSLTLSPATVSATRGSTETANLTIAPNFGFTGAIQTQCQTSAAWIACDIAAPASISGAVTIPVHILIAQTTARISPRNPAWLVSALALSLPFLIPRRNRRRFGMASILLVAASGIASCGASGYSFPVGPQSATITTTAAGTPTVTTLTINITQ